MIQYVLIAIIVLILVYKYTSIDVKLTSKQKATYEVLEKIYPELNKDVLLLTVQKWGNGPEYTFPIEGICKDGELVSDVVKRLELEGNIDKLTYFKNYMNITDTDPRV